MRTKVAIPHWEGRISPVFDVAERALTVEIAGNDTPRRSEMRFAADDIPGRIAALRAAGVDVLICAAISRPLEIAVRHAGIELIPRVCGNVEDVLQAYLAGRLDDRAFLMPGCCGRRRRQRRRHGGRGFGAQDPFP